MSSSGVTGMELTMWLMIPRIKDSKYGNIKNANISMLQALSDKVLKHHTMERCKRIKKWKNWNKIGDHHVKLKLLLS